MKSIQFEIEQNRITNSWLFIVRIKSAFNFIFQTSNCFLANRIIDFKKTIQIENAKGISMFLVHLKIAKNVDSFFFFQVWKVVDMRHQFGVKIMRLTSFVSFAFWDATIGSSAGRSSWPSHQDDFVFAFVSNSFRSLSNVPFLHLNQTEHVEMSSEKIFIRKSLFRCILRRVLFFVH